MSIFCCIPVDCTRVGNQYKHDIGNTLISTMYRIASQQSQKSEQLLRQQKIQSSHSVAEDDVAVVARPTRARALVCAHKVATLVSWIVVVATSHGHIQGIRSIRTGSWTPERGALD